MGAALRNLVDKKKAQGESLGGRGKLTQEKIKKIANYYGYALRSNINDVPAMKRAVEATLLHMTSTDDAPKHSKCPEGASSWCKYNRALANGESPPSHKNALPACVGAALEPVFARLSDESLLARCCEGKTQNASESLHSVIWTQTSKNGNASLESVKRAAAEAVAIYNQGRRATNEITVSLEWNDKVVKDTVFWFQHESDASLNSNVYTVASEVVNKHFPAVVSSVYNLAGVFGSERLLQQVVDQILEQTRLPEDSMEEDRTEGSDGEAGGVGRCRSPHGPLTTASSSSATASKFIIKGYKTLHKEELGVSETERRLLERIQGHATTSRRKHGSPERDRQSTVSGTPATSPISVVSNTSLTTAQPTLVERPNFVRVVTSDGRQGQLRPSALGITLTELRAWVTAEFGIPVERQLLKSGIPPRVLAEPPDGGALSLSHGDRVIVEVVGTDPSASGVAQGGLLNAASMSDATLEGDLVRHLQASSPARVHGETLDGCGPAALTKQASTVIHKTGCECEVPSSDYFVLFSGNPRTMVFFGPYQPYPNTQTCSRVVGTARAFSRRENACMRHGTDYFLHQRRARASRANFSPRCPSSSASALQPWLILEV
ncbi:hypothetical protein HPB52_002651 [Rhipicephalus sanguineus]|uniref:Mutator-like transposase domain-containing protein n=1 Tax=Rhipicephalus sanguineus TaxID=34632 RepID=A0A9D4PBH4_RHISA|nr:hypothetical protein HPB52_002651 [Rhipicephalus sanguineus]